MEPSIDNISLITTTILLGIINIAGLRERIVNIPKWFANPPGSFRLINQQAKKAVRFWIPVQILFFGSLVTAFITNWGIPSVRTALILATLCYVLVIVSTAVYFVKEIMAFSKMGPETALTPGLQKRADRWLRWTSVRNLLQVVALILLILAF